ncbi:MAG: nucleotidyltransferase family protein [Bacteroidales bacterium]|nr:nucleotidyltransferase family protein [Bacteroidales bacterium]
MIGINVNKEAIILAGGFGTRLQGVVKDLPKPMAPINGRPFLTYILDYLIEYQYDKVILSVGYLHEKIEEYFGSEYKNLAIDYAVETEPLGTGGGILNAMSKCTADNVLVINGDTLFKVDLNRFERFHLEKQGLLSIVLREVDDTSRYGSVAIGNDSMIILFTEKESSEGSGLINGGVYLINKKLFEKHPQPKKFSFEKDLMTKFYTQELFFAMPSDGYFIDIGIPKDYARAQEELS